MSFTPGRIIVAGGTVRRGSRKRVDYLLSYLRDRPLAVVEAKSKYRLPSDGLQQAKQYAEMLDLKFAYSTNGPGIVEHDYTTGLGIAVIGIADDQDVLELITADAADKAFHVLIRTRESGGGSSFARGTTAAAGRPLSLAFTARLEEVGVAVTRGGDNAGRVRRDPIHGRPGTRARCERRSPRG